MPVFVTLPSGLIVNLELVRRVTQSDQHGQSTLTLHFADNDVTILGSEDAAALKKRLPMSSGLTSNVKTAIFWFVILLALILVWMVIRH